MIKCNCRWNTAAANSLPSCMRSCFMALYTITNEIADMAEKEHGLSLVNHLKKAVCYQIAFSYTSQMDLHKQYSI